MKVILYQLNLASVHVHGIQLIRTKQMTNAALALRRLVC